MAKDIHSFFHPPIDHVGGVRDDFPSYLTGTQFTEFGDPVKYPPTSATFKQIYMPQDFIISERSPSGNVAECLERWKLPSDEWFEDNASDFYHVDVYREGYVTYWRYTAGDKYHGIKKQKNFIDPWYGPRTTAKEIHYSIPSTEFEISIPSSSNLSSSDYWALICIDDYMAWAPGSGSYDTSTIQFTWKYNSRCVQSLVPFGGVDEDISQSGTFDLTTFECYDIYYTNPSAYVWNDIPFEGGNMNFSTMNRNNMSNAFQGEVEKARTGGSILNEYYIDSEYLEDKTSDRYKALGIAYNVPLRDSYYPKWGIVSSFQDFWAIDDTGYSWTVSKMKTSGTNVLAGGLIVDGKMQGLPSKWRIPGSMMTTYLNYNGDYEQFIDDVKNERTVDLREKSKFIAWCRGEYEIPDDAKWIQVTSNDWTYKFPEGTYEIVPVNEMKGWPGTTLMMNLALVTGTRIYPYGRVYSEGHEYKGENRYYSYPHILFPRNMDSYRGGIQRYPYASYLQYPFDEAILNAYSQVSGDFTVTQQ